MREAELALNCAECGAFQPPGATCRLCFEGLLAYEAERPAAFGAVHHLTVSAWVLQHPAGYGQRAIAALEEQIALILDGRITIAELRARNTRLFGGAARLKGERIASPTASANDWSMHVIDVFDPRSELPSIETYVERARAWASSVRNTLTARTGA